MLAARSGFNCVVNILVVVCILDIRLSMAYLVSGEVHV